METLRKPLQGVTNIVRFNWHLYLFAFLLTAILYIVKNSLPPPYSMISSIALWAVVLTTVISLSVSLYVYDLSGLYHVQWLSHIPVNAAPVIVNINAGFDETSEIIKHKFPQSELLVYDFYNPLKHTEVSIKRARKAYPPYKGTVTVNTTALPLPKNHADYLLFLFAAHEIRNDIERVEFFKDLHRVLKPDGELIVLEHLRDTRNFLAYNIGAFHFLSLKTWYSTFNSAGFQLTHEDKITPFITKFTLTKHGSKS
jgi:SAM-dependent methyltransferase